MLCHPFNSHSHSHWQRVGSQPILPVPKSDEGTTTQSVTKLFCVDDSLVLKLFKVEMVSNVNTVR